MNTLIVYGSQYGTAQRYAEKFAGMTGLPVMSYKDIGGLAGCGRMIYFGGLYAGGVKGLRSTVGKLPQSAELVIVTVGLADVCSKENIAHIRSSLRRQIPNRMPDDAHIFHLRGGIDYGKLSFKHRAMMTALYNKVKRLPEDKRSAEDMTMIETFNSKVDFVDFSALDKIAQSIR